jgi:hypothetical protein
MLDMRVSLRNCFSKSCSLGTPHALIIIRKRLNTVLATVLYKGRGAVSLDSVAFDLFDEAIIRALRKFPKGIRNTKLNQESKVNGKCINVKTYNKHLLCLVKVGIIERNEESRAKVIYRLHPTEMDKKLQSSMEDVIRSVTKEIVELFEHRKEINIEQAHKSLDIILSSRIYKPLERLFGWTIWYTENPLEVNLNINQNVDFYRRCMEELIKIKEQNDDTRAFFNTLFDLQVLKESPEFSRYMQEYLEKKELT